MKILSVKLKSVIITMIVILAVVFGIFMTAHTLSDAVSGEARMIPIYNVDTDEKIVAITFNCAVGNSDIDSILATLDKYNGSLSHSLPCPVRIFRHKKTPPYGLQELAVQGEKNFLWSFFV